MSSVVFANYVPVQVTMDPYNPKRSHENRATGRGRSKRKDPQDPQQDKRPKEASEDLDINTGNKASITPNKLYYSEMPCTIVLSNVAFSFLS